MSLLCPSTKRVVNADESVSVIEYIELLATSTLTVGSAGWLARVIALMLGRGMPVPCLLRGNSVLCRVSLVINLFCSKYISAVGISQYSKSLDDSAELLMAFTIGLFMRFVVPTQR